ncbi:MAG: BACON domain-containing protein [Bacteroidales bacterium]|nr:BACON domain-containing protein [Bacteroidales bacterium]
MKYSNILKTVAALAAGMLLFSCQQQEEPGEARAVAASETYLAFEAQGAAQQTVEIYADGSWLVDVDSDWISVTPYEGTGMGSITISVADNVAAGVEDRPRDGKITVQGGTALRNAVITVHQDGDTYKGVQTLTLAQVAKLEDGQVAKVASAQVTALTTSGFIATDDSRSMYIKGEGVAIGDKVSFNGAKTTIGDAAAFEMDEVEVEGTAAVKYPEAKDITASIASYDYSLTEYVSISASLVGTNIYLSADVQVPLLDPVESLELGSIDLHKVVVKGYGVGKSVVAVSVEDGGMNEALIPYPLKFKVRTGINYNSDSWSETSKIPPVNGLGYIEYVPFDLEHTDTPANPKYKLDVSDNSPRVTGPWPGDYWLFYGNGAIKAGSEVHIAFESRTSATGHKFWILEFLDGSEWRPACETFTTTEPGEEVIYTHAMNADGKTNVQADYVVKYRKNSEHAQFRFRCVANWQASGAGPLKARNGGSARLTVTDTADPTYQPVIEIIKEGNGVERDPVYANIEVSTDLLTFNGTPAAPKTITVTSDHDFTVSSTADWLSFDVTEGLAGEETAIAVTCAQSELSELRQAVIKIVSEDSEKSINVVQSAAGQMLDPFISVSSGNSMDVPALEGSKVVKIQSNTDFSAESLAAWLTLEKVETKAMVEWTEYEVTYAANEEEAERTGQIRFYNEAQNLEALVTIVQAGKAPAPLYPDGVYFQDDFEWLAPWTGSLPDDVTNNSVGSAGNVFSTSYADALAELQTRGYGYIWGWKDQEWSDGTPDSSDKQTLYLMKNYLKFGKTDYSSGIILPALSTINGTANVDLTFDWCWCMTAKKKPDYMTLTVCVSGGGTIESTGTEVSAEIESSQPTEGDATVLEWQHASIRIIGATPSTRITIRPTNNDPSVSNKDRRQNRWYLDNIKVAEPEPVVLYEDDFSWLKEIADAAGAGDGVGKQESGATAPNVYTFDEAGSAAFFNLFNAKGYEDLNPSAKVMYLQKYYLKFSKGKAVGGIRLPAVEFGDSPSDAVLEFDWCAQMGGSGSVDAVSLNVELTGSGLCGDSGAAVSGEIAHSQETGQMFWQHVKLPLKNVTNATRIEIKPKQFGATSGYYRWFLDNIKITK